MKADYALSRLLAVPGTTSAPLSRAALVALTKVLAGSSVRWVGCEPSTRQRLYFANHTSHLDVLVLWTALPPAVRLLTRPVAARDYWQVGQLRQHLAINVFNAVLIDRHPAAGDHSRHPLEPLLTALDDARRHSLILFPEGTRGSNLGPAAFKSGLYHLAKQRPTVELVPDLVAAGWHPHFSCAVQLRRLRPGSPRARSGHNGLCPLDGR